MSVPICIVAKSQSVFSEGSGRILNKLLLDSGISKTECAFYTIQGSTYGKVVEEIKGTHANVVVAFGNEVMELLVGHPGVDNWRGSILFPCRVGIKVIPTIAPDVVMHRWEYVPLVLFDLVRVKEESGSGEYVVPVRDFVLAPTLHQVTEYLTKMHKQKRVAFDIETCTVGERVLITAIAFADSPFSAISIPFTFAKGVECIPYWTTVQEEMYVMQMCKELLEDGKVEKVAQNAQFDCSVLAVNPPYIDVYPMVLDTMCAHHTCYPELPKGLDVLCSIYTRQPYYKHWANDGTDVTFWKYNAMDSAVTYECGLQIEKEMGEYGVTQFYHKFVHPLIPILAKMQIRGIRIDQNVRVQEIEELEGEVGDAQKKLEKELGHEVNPNSPKQLAQLLYTDMGLLPKFARLTGNLTTNEKALQELAARYPSPLFDLILKIRGNRKLLGTYLNKGGTGDGRMRCSYVIGGTETGRLSSRKSIFGTGTNLQNVPKGVCRRMFIPDEGECFIEGDLSQAEARVVAFLSASPQLLQLFSLPGGDINRLNGSWIFGKPQGEVTKEEREKAKRGVHALNYGMGPVLFSHLFGCSVSEGRVLSQKYFDTFPHIRQWQAQLQTQIGKCKTIQTPLGRKRTFYGRWGDALFREVYAYVPQSTVADILNLALISWCVLKEQEKKKEWEVVLQVHDAFIVQVPVGEKEQAIDGMRKAFVQPFNITGIDGVKRVCEIPVELKWGGNWNDMEKV